MQLLNKVSYMEILMVDMLVMYFIASAVAADNRQDRIIQQ